VEIELYELKNDVQIIGASGMMLCIIIYPRQVTHLVDMQSACDTMVLL